MAWVRQNVVVPVDFSDASVAAVEVGLEMLSESGNIHVIHVLGKLSPTDPGEIWDTVTDESREQHVMKALKKKFTGDHHHKLQFAVSIGDPGHEIVEFARKQQADAIVMPCRGTSGLKRLMIGSVAERVVRMAHCPVVVLRD